MSSKMGSLPTVHVPGSTSNSRKTKTIGTSQQCRSASQPIWSKKPGSKSGSRRLEKGLRRWVWKECRDSLDHDPHSSAAPREFGNRLLPNEKGVNDAYRERLAFQEVRSPDP